MDLFRAIAEGEGAQALRLLEAAPLLATLPLEVGASREDPKTCFFERIGHYVYAGDTALHVAAAAYDVGVARVLLERDANPRARNRRGAEPLHYAADGAPGSPAWNPEAQAAVIALLVEHGADPNTLDKSGVAPLHRAVRTRCSAAVQALLQNGAAFALQNKSGSTPLQLATRATGRGGSGDAAAREQQRLIIQILTEHGARS